MSNAFCYMQAHTVSNTYVAKNGLKLYFGVACSTREVVAFGLGTLFNRRLRPIPAWTKSPHVCVRCLRVLVVPQTLEAIMLTNATKIAQFVLVKL